VAVSVLPIQLISQALIIIYTPQSNPFLYVRGKSSGRCVHLPLRTRPSVVATRVF
jgi:hypothetical protein